MANLNDGFSPITAVLNNQVSLGDVIKLHPLSISGHPHSHFPVATGQVLAGNHKVLILQDQLRVTGTHCLKESSTDQFLQSDRERMP